MVSRKVKSLALAGLLSLTLSGCSLIAPVATSEPYSASDGVNQNVADVKVRNLMLIGAETGDPLNVVFTAVNEGSEPQTLHFNFVADNGSEAAVDFILPPGMSSYGDPAQHNHGAEHNHNSDHREAKNIQLVDLGAQQIGSTVKTYLHAGNSNPQEISVPVLDGTLKEYRKYVLTESSADSNKSDSHESGH